MKVAPVIHIGGWPGAGKRSIGAILADRYGGRLLDNHGFLDLAQRVFDRNTRECAGLRRELRAVVLRAALSLPPAVPVIFTDALSDDPADEAMFQPVVDFARDRGADLRCIVLDIEEAENIVRLTDVGRGGFKLRDPKVLRQLRGEHRLLQPAGAWHLDVTGLSAAEAAAAIARETGLADG